MSRALPLVLALVLSAPAAAHAQPAQAVVQGRVTGADGAGMAYASVHLAGTTAGAATDPGGRFRFTTEATGRHELRARAVGYAQAVQQIELAPGDTVVVQFTLEEAVVEMEAAVVAASPGGDSPPLADAPRIDALQAVTTDGVAGDPLRAVKFLPGAQATGDDSGLFVRGGERNETRLLLDDAPVMHPYRQETPTGGAFGTLPPFLVEGMHFSAGGFSARYGDALSGVLAMKTPDRPQETSGTVGLGLAAASVRAGVPITDRIGLRVSANRSFTGLLFRLNGQAGDFPTPPRATDGSASLLYRYGEQGRGGRIKVFAFATRSRLAAEERANAVSGVFSTASATQLYFADWTHRAGPWRLEATLSTDRHGSEWSFGNARLDETDRSARLRLDATREVSEHLRLTTGAEAARRTSAFGGRVPAGPGAQPPGTSTIALSGERASGWQGGAYAEARADLTDRLSVRAGFRADDHTRVRSATLAPRLQLRYRLAHGTHAVLAWGRYHQFPTPEEFGRATETLRAERARHVIGGVRHARGEWTARLEAYFKPYDDLVVETPAGDYANAGSGHAYGLDAFARYGAFLRTRFSGWASYSFLQSRRTQLRRLGGRRVLDDGPTPNDATHSLTLVGKVQVGGGFFAGGTFRWATGRPVTPIVDAVPASEDTGRFLPVEGPVGAERRPDFRRLDFQLSYYRPFGSGRAATFYASLANALGRRNVNGYAYATDYSERRPVFSPYRQLFYAGVTVDF